MALEGKAAGAGTAQATRPILTRQIMRSQCIMSGGPYKLISFGNGTAYSLENHCFDSVDSDPLSVFVQGDDAAQFRDRIDAMESAHPTMPTRDVLGEVWAAYYQGEEA